MHSVFHNDGLSPGGTPMQSIYIHEDTLASCLVIFYYFLTTKNYNKPLSMGTLYKSKMALDKLGYTGLINKRLNNCEAGY